MSPSSSDQQSNFCLLGPKDKPSDFGFYGIVYRAVNSVNGKVYIGLTTQSLKRRINSHLVLSKAKKNFYFQKAIQKYGIDSFLFEIIAECLTKEELGLQEAFYISKYCSTSREVGYNLTYGGEGLSRPTPETKKRMSEAAKRKKLSPETKDKLRKYHTGRKRTEDTKEKMCIAQKKRPRSEEDRQRMRTLGLANKGKKHSDKTRKNMSESAKKRKASPETRRKLSLVTKWHSLSKESIAKRAKKFEKPVQKLDDLGNVLESFSSVHEAVEKCKIGQSSISLVCLGRQKTAGGFFWRFKNDVDRFPPIEGNLKSKKVRSVIQLDKAGNILEIFSSIAGASRKSSANASSIVLACKGRLKTAGGFIWKYKEDIKND